MEVAPGDCESGWLYRALSSTVVPRPIAWVSSTSPDGVDNLAPYSFFNAVSVDPPMLMFAPQDRSDRPEGLSDTARNILAREEYVVNTVGFSQADRMNASSASLPPGESEFDAADIERGPTAVVDAPRVADAPVSFECTLSDAVEVGSGRMIVGEVVYLHVDDALLTDGSVDVEKTDFLGRLAGSRYASTRDRTAIERPD